MARVRRATHVFFRCRDARLLDMEELLRGRLSIGARSEDVAVSLLTGEESPLTREELEALVDLPAEWTDLDELPEQARPLVADLARRGLVVGDDADPRLAELRRRDERHFTTSNQNGHPAEPVVSPATAAIGGDR